MKLYKPHSKLVKELSQKQTAPAVSIIMPTHPSSPPEHIKEDQSRFNNATRSVIRELDDSDYHQDVIDSFKTRLAEIHEDIEFWRHQAEGLAVYMDKDATYAIGLPREPQEHIVINGAFHITPLLFATQLNKKFFILQPSYKDPQLLKADWYDIEQAEGIDLPSGVDEALRIDEHQASLQYHPSPKGGGDMTGYHGHGGAKDEKDQEREQYHKVLDGIVAPFVNKSDRVVVLAGPDEEVATYRAQSDINAIADYHIEGNIQTYSKQELHNRLHEVIDKVVEDEQEALVEKLHQKNVLFDSDEIGAAIEEGRVGSLYVGLSADTTDHAKDHAHIKTVIQHGEGAGSSDDIDTTIMRTVQFGGDVVGVKQQLIPNNSLIAATLRY